VRREAWGVRREAIGSYTKPEFDALCATVTGYAALDDRIAKTRAKRTERLQVLAHPELP